MAKQRGASWRPWGDHPFVVLIATIAALLAIIGYFSQFWSKRIEVQTAEVQTVGDISPDRCTFKTPCLGLKRGSTLRLKLTGQGYAAAFLQDDPGKFFNQEGRLIVSNVIEGSSGLWPGINPKVSHPVFKLWVVTSDSAITTSEDSTPLATLPSGSNGITWGPVYLGAIQ